MAKTLKFGDHLTGASYDSSFRKTFVGMAHIAGTGPDGAMCLGCVFFSSGRKEEGTCGYKIPNKSKATFPKRASACRFFVDATKDAPR